MLGLAQHPWPLRDHSCWFPGSQRPSGEAGRLAGGCWANLRCAPVIWPSLAGGLALWHLSQPPEPQGTSAVAGLTAGLLWLRCGQGTVGTRRWAGRASGRGLGKPGLGLTLSPLPACFHGKYEPRWTRSKRKGFHCSGFRPGVWGPSPCLAFLPASPGLGTNRSKASTQPPSWPGRQTLGSFWPGWPPP